MTWCRCVRPDVHAVLTTTMGKLQGCLRAAEMHQRRPPAAMAAAATAAALMQTLAEPQRRLSGSRVTSEGAATVTATTMTMASKVRAVPSEPAAWGGEPNRWSCSLLSPPRRR